MENIFSFSLSSVSEKKFNAFKFQNDRFHLFKDRKTNQYQNIFIENDDTILFHGVTEEILFSPIIWNISGLTREI